MIAFFFEKPQRPDGGSGLQILFSRDRTHPTVSPVFHSRSQRTQRTQRTRRRKSRFPGDRTTYTVSRFISWRPDHLHGLCFYSVETGPPTRSPFHFFYFQPVASFPPISFLRLPGIPSSSSSFFIPSSTFFFFKLSNLV